MQTDSFIPSSLSDAKKRIHTATRNAPELLENTALIKAWFAVAYAYPGLHPDDYDTPESSWPEHLQPLAKEIWSRAEFGKIPEDFIYPSDSQWAGIYDCLNNPSAEEQKHRLDLHMQYLA